MIKDDLSLKGRLTIAVNGQTVREVPNLVVTTGKEFVASRMAGVSSSEMSHMAIGTSSTAAAAGDTALGSEVARVALSSTTVTGADVVYVATFAAGTPATSAAVVEAAIFNGSTGGDMLCRTTFPVVNKGTNDSITITWTVTVS